MCDYLASRKVIDVKFDSENNIEEWFLKLKKILVSNLDVFIYELKMEFDNINKDYVIVNEDGFCEFHIDNFIFQN